MPCGTTIAMTWFVLLRSHVIAIASIAGLTFFALGCEPVQDTTETDTQPTTQTDGGQPDPEKIRPKVDDSILFTPREVFTGFDGTHPYTFPIKVDGADAMLTVVASDASALEVVPAKLVAQPEDGDEDKGRYYLVTVKKAGTFTLTGTSRGLTATAEITATAYTTARWTAGERRYKTGGGAAADQKACTTCHNAEQGAPDHSPASLAGVDDMRVRETITDGILADGTSIFDYFSVEHKWQANATELDGLVTYLRSLPQKKVVPE